MLVRTIMNKLIVKARGKLTKAMRVIVLESFQLYSRM